MPAKSYNLLNYSNKNIKIAISGVKCLYLTVGEDVYMVNQSFVEDSLEYSAQDKSIIVDLHCSQNQYYGKVIVDGEEYQIIPPLSSTYSLYISDQEYVEGNSEEATTFWKKLKLVTQLNSDNELGVAYYLDDQPVQLTMAHDALEYRAINEDIAISNNEIASFSLTYNTAADYLAGYYQKQVDNENKVYQMVGKLEGSFDHPLHYVDSDKNLSVDELLSLSPIYYVNDEAVDEAQKNASDAFLKLMMYCMDENWRTVFFNQSDQPTIDDDLKEILQTNIAGESETAIDFYKRYSVPYIAHVIYNATTKDDAADSIDIKRVDAFLENGAGYEPNYINQTNLLYTYGYKKAVSRITDYIKDQDSRGNVFWAQQMLYTLKQPGLAIELVGLMKDYSGKNQAQVRKQLNSWIFKMNLLDPSCACSKELSKFLCSGMMNSMVSDFYINSLDDDMNLTTIPDKADMETFLDSLDSTTIHIAAEEEVQRAIQDLTRESRENYELAIALYQFSAVMGACQKFIVKDAELETKLAALAKKSKFHASIFSKIPASKMKIFCSVLGFGAGVVSTILLGMVGDFSSLTTVQKAFTISTLVTFSVKSLIKPIVLGFDKLFRYSFSYFERLANSVLLLSNKTFSKGLAKIMSASAGKVLAAWGKVSQILLKAVAVITKVCGFILQVLSIAMSVLDLIDSIQSGDVAGIVLNSIMIGAGVGELVVMAIGLFVTSAALSVVGAVFLVIGIIALLVELFRPRETEPHKFVFSSKMDIWRVQDRSEREMWMKFEQADTLVSGSYKATLKHDSLQITYNGTTKTSLELTGTQSDYQVLLCIDTTKCCIKDTEDNLYRALYFNQEFAAAELPLVLSLQSDGGLYVRTNNKSKQFALDATEFPSCK